jgi:hypothetical protein
MRGRRREVRRSFVDMVGVSAKMAKKA